MINRLSRMVDNELYCEVILKEEDSYFFPAEDYYDNDGNYGVLLIKNRRSNWDTILEMIPLIGEAHIHFMMITEGIEEREQPPLLQYYEHWRKGIYWLKLRGFKIDEAACYKDMLRRMT